MLTDFDLSKGSNPPGNPTVVKSNSPNVVYKKNPFIMFAYIYKRLFFFFYV